jgi:hypothetical protein
VTLYETSESTLETEIRIIETALGGKRWEEIIIKRPFNLLIPLR